ncbi:MAG: hypothetical protein JXB49_36400 [Bacteroidales bacterium]|nr:hypothetical protein [Bacteroidales bacterium]
MKIIFLHHSTGQLIWDAGERNTLSELAFKVNKELSYRLGNKGNMYSLIRSYNKEHHTDYHIEEQVFPQMQPYGWHNYPYDYFNIWVKNAGHKAYMEEPTLEMLTGEYQVIIFKHCFPVSNIQADLDTNTFDSDYKSLGNYKSQYLLLRDKLHSFRNTKFILWTGAAQVKSQISEEEALRAKAFFSWVSGEWDLPDDNIFIWDLYSLEAGKDLYLDEKYARSPVDSHPNSTFASNACKLFFQRMIDVIENDGKNTTLTGTYL